jgi:carbonic anhydrase
VHQAADKSLAVIGVMIKEGQTNGFIEKVVNSLPKETTPATLVAGAQIKGTDFMPSNKAYYRFQGSLTTPPCSEGVSWVLLKTPMTASKAQLDALSQVLNHNNRPVQPTHGRAVRG